MFSWQCSRIPLSWSRTQSLGSIKEESESLEDELPSESDEDDGATESDGNDFSAPVQRSSLQTTSESDDFSDALQHLLLEMEEKRRSGFCTSMIRQPSTEHSFLRLFPQNLLPTATPSMDRNYSFSTVSPASDFYFSPGSEGNTKRPREDALEDIRSPKRIQRCSSRHSTITDETTPTFRGWKRSRSERKDYDMPSPRKKARPTHCSYSVSQPASLRRAQSLRADTLLSSSSSGSSGSTSRTYTPTITPTGTFRIPHLGNSPPDSDWIPTAPSSPEPVPVQRNTYAHLPPELFLPSRFGVTRSSPRDPVPIIAPPSDHTAMLALSSEAQAKRRLQLYVSREHQRHQIWELGCRNQTSTFDDWENAIGIGQKLRRKVVGWILEATLRRHEGEDLHDQITALSTSRETRFHAAYLFLLFFFCSGGTEGVECDGFEDTVWDMAVGAVAVSVKYHRDFLPPLFPVYTSSLQALAPHEIGFGDLEGAQADLLSAVGYVLGGTPVGVLDELLDALPSLRELFPDEGEWSRVLRETWRSLMICILEPDILNFPISLLSAAAVSEAVLDVLLHRKVSSRDKYKDELREETEEEAEGILLDVQNVLGIGEREMHECREWIVGVKRDWCEL